ncbi:MAG TPA: hypothetical protein VGN72_03890 [Tepidisphaeraceae bacterium]|jgi:prepilin-type processing-associated H-X9-DG protein|nr:hypothetical protein [Tepidisphaeraceae bacterium]
MYGVNFSFPPNSGTVAAGIRQQRLFPYQGAPGQRNRLRLGQIRRSTQLIMLGDAEQRNSGIGRSLFTYDDTAAVGTQQTWFATSQTGWPAAVHPGGAAPTGIAYLNDVGARRKRSANIGFFDGHVESVSLRDLQQNTADMWGVRNPW